MTQTLYLAPRPEARSPRGRLARKCRDTFPAGGCVSNDSDYGLSGIVWSADVERAHAAATRMRTGQVGINGYFLDWAVPFGGMKASGLGREFGPAGLLAFCETQAVHWAR